MPVRRHLVTLHIAPAARLARQPQTLAWAPRPEDWPQTPLPRPQPLGDVSGVVARFPGATAAGVPEGRVPMGPTVTPDGPGLDPGARSRGGDAPVGLEALVRFCRPMALSKVLLLGPAVWGLVVLCGRGLGMAGVLLWSLASATEGAWPVPSKVMGEGPRMLEGPLGRGAPDRMMPDSST